MTAHYRSPYYIYDDHTECAFRVDIEFSGIKASPHFVKKRLSNSETDREIEVRYCYDIRVICI